MIRKQCIDVQVTEVQFCDEVKLSATTNKFNSHHLNP